MKRASSGAILLMAAVLALGCAGMQQGHGAATGGQEAFRNGVLTVGYEKDIVGTYQATLKALTDLGMTIRSSNKDENLAAIQATRPDDMAPVVITLNRRSQGMTAADIKVGESGNEKYSRVVAGRIGARLKG